MYQEMLCTFCYPLRKRNVKTDKDMVGVLSQPYLRDDGKVHWRTTAELGLLVSISCIMQITFVYGRSYCARAHSPSG